MGESHHSYMPSSASAGGDMRGVTMDCKDVMNALFTHDYMDEVETANKYLDYAVALDNEGKSCIAKKFAEMGYEEYTHAYVQRDLLLDHGFTPSYEQTTAYEQLKHRIHTLFRK